MIFISLDYSPWSDKARWVLDHSAVSYRNKAYVSMIGTPWLRVKTKKLRGAVSVPVLLKEGGPLTDSFDIAVYADQCRSNSAPSLFPCVQTAQEWNQLSEEALSIGRYLCVLKQLKDEQAQREVLPTFIPHGARPYFTWLARSGLEYHLKKYNVDVQDKGIYRDILLKLRHALEGQSYILGTFSYCDIVMALALQYVKPVAHRYSVQGPAAEKCWTDYELLEEFEDLIEWRDWLYSKHR